jgi:hypothetical protein
MSSEVKEGFECGIKLKNYNDIKEGDQLEVFEIKEIARTLVKYYCALGAALGINQKSFLNQRE